MVAAGSVLASAALVFSTVGCAIKTPPSDLARREVQPPNRFSTTRPVGSTGKVADNWLAEFKDETLLALADEAMEKNPDIRLLAARWEEARARTRLATSYLWPQVDGAGSAIRQANGGGPMGPVTTYNQYNISARINWEVDLWGRLRSDAAAARQFAAASRMDYEAARQSIATAVADAWFVAIQARLQRAIDAERLEAERLTAKITRDRVEVGARGPLDVSLSDAAVNLSADAVQRDEASLAESIKGLEALLGRYPAAELAVAADLPAMPQAVPVGVPSELLERRPDVIAADRRVAAAFHNVESIKATRLPQVMLTASLGTLVDPSDMIWSLGATVLGPIISGGRSEAGVSIATALQKQALANYVGVAIAAFREVETALSNEYFLATRVAEIEQASTRLRNASRIGEDRYDAGLLTIIELIVIRRQDFETRTQLLQLRTNRLRQRLTLYRALGGSFDAAGTQFVTAGSNVAPRASRREQK